MTIFISGTLRQTNHYRMKRKFLLFFLTTLLIGYSRLNATHIVGSELFYECINPVNYTYRVTLKLYRDCINGRAQFDNVITLFIFDRNTGNAVQFINIFRPAQTPEIQPERWDNCVATPPQICVEEGIYTANIFLPPRPGGYDIAWARCCRNEAITNLRDPLGEGVTYLASIPDPGDAPCNTMPQFTQVPPVFLCRDQQFSFDHSATDADGDSLSYQITNPYTGINNQGRGAGNPERGGNDPVVTPGGNPMGPPPYRNVQFAPGYSFNDPFGSQNFNIDPETGFITVTPNQTGIFVFAISVFEWRDGVLLSENKRDFQIHILDCLPPGDPPEIKHDFGEIPRMGDTLLVNALEPFCYDVEITDPNLMDQLTAYTVSAAFGKGTFSPPAATFTFGGINPLSGQVCWRPSCAYENQTVPLVLGARDITACPNFGDVFDTVWVKVQVPPNVPPVIEADYSSFQREADTLIVEAEAPFCLPYTVIDPDDNPITTFALSELFERENGPELTILSADGREGEICWEPGCEYQDSVIQLSFGARDLNVCSNGSPVTETFFLKVVLPPNQAPEITYTFTNLTAIGDTILIDPLIPFCYEVALLDPDQDDSLTFVAASPLFQSDSTLSFTFTGNNPAVGQVCWTPSCEYSGEIIELVLMAKDQAACDTDLSTYDTVYVKISAPVGKVPDVGHDLNGNEVSGDTVFIDINEGLCYSFYVADNNPINPIDYNFEFQRFNGTNINLGETEVVFRNDSIIGNVCFNSDCSNGGSLYRAIITGLDKSVCPPFASASDTVFIRVRTAFISELGPDLSFCAGEGGTQLNAVSEGGNGPYFYDWGCTDSVNCGFSDPFIGNPIVNPESSTTFYVQITDKDGCTSEIDSLTIEIQNLPVVDVGPDTGLCVGDPGIALSASILNPEEVAGKLDFSWFPTEGLSDPISATPLATPDSSTIYTVVVTDSLGCSSQATNLDTKSSLYVGVSTPPIAEAGDDQQICQGDTLQLLGIATEGTANYAYLWFSEAGIAGNPQSATPTVAPQTSATYYLTAISDGCVGNTDSMIVSVSPRPLMEPIADLSMCAYDSVQLSASITNYPVNSINYIWAKDDTPISQTQPSFWVQPEENATYQLSVISEEGCKSVIQEIAVEVFPTPWVNVGGDQFICLGDSILLNGTLSWSGGNGSDYPEEATYTWNPSEYINGTTATIFASPVETEVITVTVSHEQCETSDEIRIDVFEALDMELTADTLNMCLGDTLNISATVSRSSAFFNWEPAEWVERPMPSNILVSPTTSLLYKARAELGGCIIEDSVFVNVRPTPVADISVEPSVICLGDPVAFESDPTTGDNYIWDPGDGSEFLSGAEVTHIYTESGVYEVDLEVSTFNGCLATSSFSFVEVLPKGIAMFEVVAETSAVLPAATFTFNNLSDGAVSYSWDFGDGTTSEQESPTHTYREAGSYTVSLRVIDQAGCESSFTLGPINITPPTLFIPNVFSPNEDGTHDTFLAQYDGVEAFSMMIVDRWGVSQYKSTDAALGWNGKDEDGNTAQEGVYYYVIKVGDKSYRGSLTLLR